MADRPRFRARFESALQTYGQTTGLALAEHPLAVRIQSCHSAESITTILIHEARASSDLLGSDRSTNLIESIVSMLLTLSVTTSLGDAIGLVRKVHHCGLLGGCYIPKHFHSHTHLRKRYSLASLSYSLYVAIYSTFITVL
jgi:hypothetical protein